MIRVANLHEIVREVLRSLDVELPGRFVTVEHRGDGEGEWDLDAVAPAIEMFLRAAFVATPAGEALWVRSDARSADDLRVEVAPAGVEKPQVFAVPRFTT